MQYVNEIPDAPYEIRIYRGADGEFTIYEDAGDGYEYEHGAFALIRLIWDDKRGELVVEKRQGSFKGMVETREYNFVFISNTNRITKKAIYTGNLLRVSPKE
jgi:alpha-D-xyloside xylohydrolase